MSEEAGAGPNAASAGGAVAEATMGDAPATVGTAKGAVDDAERPSDADAPPAAAPECAKELTAAELVAAEEQRAKAGGLLGERLPEGWVDLSLNERLMKHPPIEVSSRK